MALAITGVTNSAGGITIKGTNRGPETPIAKFDGMTVTLSVSVSGDWSVTIPSPSTGSHIFRIKGSGKDLELPIDTGVSEGVPILGRIGGAP